MGWNCSIKHFEEKSKMETETKRGHKVLKIIGIILLILFSVGVIFFIKGKIHERRPWYDNNYFDDFKTDAVLDRISVIVCISH